MTNKKNRFFTLVFSCCPGAGEMYLGLYRQGVSLMGLFFGTIALAAWLGFEELIFFICPIVWCYSFFHTHNLRRMTEEEFAAVEDKFIFADYVNLNKRPNGNRKRDLLQMVCRELFQVLRQEKSEIFR